MKLDEQLNLVVPVSGNAGTVYVHSTPISREAFEAHFKLIAEAHADMFGRGGAYATVAPRVAALTLREVGRRLAREADPEASAENFGPATTLLADVKRLSVIATATADGWRVLPVDKAIADGHLDAEDWREVESAICFFTCLYWMTERRTRAQRLQVMASAIGLSTTASPPSEWIASLPRSTPEADSTEPALNPGEIIKAPGAVSLAVSR